MADGGAGWRIDEVAHAGREHLEPGHPERYDRKEDADAAAELAYLRRHGIGADSTVVDLGAGTGQFALAAAAEVRRVIAVDVSPLMLDRLRAKAGEADVECVEAGFLTFEPDEPVDLVYSRLALHHLPDFWKAVALERIATMLRPGGLFRLVDVVFSFEPGEAGEALERWVAAGAEAGDEEEWTRAELEEHVRDEHSTFSWLLEAMIERAGLEIVDAETFGDGFYARYLCRRPG